MFYIFHLVLDLYMHQNNTCICITLHPLLIQVYNIQTYKARHTKQANHSQYASTLIKMTLVYVSRMRPLLIFIKDKFLQHTHS